MEYVRFSNENIQVKIEENVRGCDVFFIQTSCPPVNDHLMELLIALDALKYASAGRITAVLPYYPYGCLTARTNRESQSLAASSPTSSQKQGLIASLR